MGKRKILTILFLWIVLLLGTTGTGLYVKQSYSFPVEQPQKTIRDSIVELASSQVGVRQTGDNTGPEIDQYLACSGLTPGYPWCAAYVCWLYDSLKIPVPTGSAWSPNWFPESRVINKEEAEKGDVFGIYFISLGRVGHVGILEESWEDSKNVITTIEGNTNNSGSRTGDGVYRKYRSKNQIRSVANWNN